MAVKFPHVGNDAYPHLDTVQPFRREVPFDYGRYDYTATIKLCSVPWTSDYAHVINWKSESDRDGYFAGLSGHTATLASGFARTQLDSVRVNIPYDVALTYNYVYMQVPVLTENQPIDHETQDGIRTVCAWIQEAIYQAPSATELVLAIDYWTTYLPHIQTQVGMMLHRGHAPAYGIDVDTYLSNPREHCADLLTPDVDFGTYDESVSSTLIDIAQGEKMIVLASSIPYGDISSLTLATPESGSSTIATYYDTGSRDGHQVGVSGYGWHYGGRSYEGMNNPSAYSGIGASMPTYEYLYAIEAASASTILLTLASRLPQFISSIRAAYILPRRVLVLASTAYDIAGVTLYRVNPTSALNDLAGLTLDKQSFGYPTRYADIAKLYTSPYAHMVISDALGQSLDVRIEDMGADVRILEQVSPLTDCLRWDVLLSGVNDAGTDTYTWTSINGSNRSMCLPGADIGRYTLELGIPTYALYLDGKTSWAMSAYQEAQATREGAIVGYQSAMRSANTGLENANDSADTGKANADASADTGKSNADASANTSVTNVANDGSNARSNAVIANNLRTISTAENITTQNNLNSDAVQNIYDSSNADLEYTEDATDINLKSEAVSSIQNMVGNAIGGNAMGAINAGVSGIINITTSEALADLSMQNVLDHQAISQAHSNNANSYHVSNAANQANYANQANTNTTNNNISTANTNATNSANTAKANATRTRDTSKANATRTQTVSKNNAAYARATGETNAKAALELARESYVMQGQAHSLDNPMRFGAVSGNHEPDALMRRVLQVRIETQSVSAIARAGDLMRRYGYSYDGYWMVTDWCPSNRRGCYWEATDVTVDASAIANPSAFAAFVAILKAGVTVWNDPNQIGGLPW